MQSKVSTMIFMTIASHLLHWYLDWNFLYEQTAKFVLLNVPVSLLGSCSWAGPEIKTHMRILLAQTQKLEQHPSLTKIKLNSFNCLLAGLWLGLVMLVFFSLTARTSSFQSAKQTPTQVSSPTRLLNVAGIFYPEGLCGVWWPDLVL